MKNHVFCIYIQERISERYVALECVHMLPLILLHLYLLDAFVLFLPEREYHKYQAGMQRK